MSDPDVPVAAARLAALAARLDDPSWEDAAQALVAGADPPGAAPPATWHHLAMAGLDLVGALVAAGRWGEAEVHAAHLAAHFHETRWELHPVAAMGFAALRDSVRARDQEGMDDAAGLIREILGGAGDAGGEGA
ncbi:MAG TPA: hypothetical protein VNT51_12290 [Miltoncostaeaceae bacterium]|nr:hypothetical protein [Miltoncostaeaceae bacterium]